MTRYPLADGNAPTVDETGVTLTRYDAGISRPAVPHPAETYTASKTALSFLTINRHPPLHRSTPRLTTLEQGTNGRDR